MSLKQEEEKKEKVDRWEIWIIRIKELQGKCQEKMKDLKSKSEPQNKKDVEEQIILANVSNTEQNRTEQILLFFPVRVIPPFNIT